MVVSGDVEFIVGPLPGGVKEELRWLPLGARSGYDGAS